MTNLELLHELGIISATILTPTSICFNRNLNHSPFRSFVSATEIQALVKALLDAGLPIQCYWKDIDYGVVDSRLGKGTMR